MKKEVFASQTIFPPIAGKTLKRNGTHIAIRTSTEIQIWTIGLNILDETGGDLIIDPEHCWSIPFEESDDLFAIFERLDEDNRINMAEALSEFNPTNKL
jgi:hypothetical protein